MTDERGRFTVLEILRMIKNGGLGVDQARDIVARSGDPVLTDQLDLGIAELQNRKNVGTFGAQKTKSPEPKSWFPSRRR
jgi:hypothetical protein